MQPRTRCYPACCSHTLVPQIGARRCSIIEAKTLATIGTKPISLWLIQSLRVSFLKMSRAIASPDDNGIGYLFHILQSKEEIAFIKTSLPRFTKAGQILPNRPFFPGPNGWVSDYVSTCVGRSSNTPRVYSCWRLSNYIVRSQLSGPLKYSAERPVSCYLPWKSSLYLSYVA